MRKDIKFENYFDIIEILFNTMSFVFFKDINGIYRSGNLNQAQTFGFNHPSEFIGKTIFEILQDTEAAKLIDQTDREVMQSNTPIILEEIIHTPFGYKTFLCQKQPIHDQDNNVIGMLGYAMDISEIRAKQQQAEAEKERLEKEKYQIEIDNYKKLTQQQSEFQQIARQVAHDIVSPLSAFSTILSMLKDIPEKHRLTLKQAATRIEDITNDLLRHYQNTDGTITDVSKNEPEIFFTYIGLRDILSEKRIEYHSLPITFTHHIDNNAYFAFIQVDSKSFQRMLSNLINNAVEAMKGRVGTVRVKLSMTNDTVVVIISDNGKGIPQSVQSKILQGISVTEGKASGHGIGLCQVHDTLQQSNGTLTINSNEGTGTEMILTFPKASTPRWAATQLVLNANQTVLILDDDPFIHGAWEARFTHILAVNPGMQIIHFTKGNELLDFLAPFNHTEKNQFYLLSDHELIDQEMHGLEIIAHAKLKNATLVTSHYTNPHVLAFANELHIPILPKRLASKVPIKIIPQESHLKTPTTFRKTDIVLLDDSQVFADSIIFRLSHRNVTHYLDPREFIAECEQFAKDTPICIDNHFGVDVEMDGVEVAKQLHALGFTRLYIVSGAYFEAGTLPEYVTLIKKMNLDVLDLL